MDNQQLSLSEFDLGWMIGIIDGEGCIGLWSRGGERKHTFKPGLRMSNTSKVLIDKFTGMLDIIECPYHIIYYKPRNERSKEYWTVSIEGFKRLTKILPLIKDRLVEKNQQANLVWEWVQSRSSKWHHSELSYRELEIPKIVSAMNHRGFRN